MKNTNIIIRISEQEKAKVKEAAEANGMTVSELLLYLIRKEIYK